MAAIALAIGGAAVFWVLSPKDDHGDGYATATEVTIGTAVVGAIETGSDQDFFAFQAEGGEAYVIEVDEGTLKSSLMALGDLQGLLGVGEEVAEGTGPTLSWDAPSAGTFYIGVANADDVATGSYTLRVRRQASTGGPATAITLPIGDVSSTAGPSDPTPVPSGPTPADGEGSRGPLSPRPTTAPALGGHPTATPTTAPGRGGTDPPSAEAWRDSTGWFEGSSIRIAFTGSFTAFLACAASGCPTMTTTAGEYSLTFPSLDTAGLPPEMLSRLAQHEASGARVESYGVANADDNLVSMTFYFSSAPLLAVTRGDVIGIAVLTQ